MYIRIRALQLKSTFYEPEPELLVQRITYAIYATCTMSNT
jgi:hypothetical protein